MSVLPARPQISILLPAHNAADTLDEALASLSAQTLTEWECLLVDDGSTDATPELAAAWSRRDRRVRLLRHARRQGIVGALTHAAAEARAPVLARQDADDRSHPQRLARTLALLQSDARLGAVASQVRLFPAEALGAGLRVYAEWLNAALSPQEIARDLWIESPLPHPAVLMRREAYDACGGYREVPWPEDYDLWLRLHNRGWRFAKVAAALYEWRHHGGRLTFRDPRYRPAAFLACKLQHLAPRLQRHRLLIWGAGRDGRRLARALRARRLEPSAFIDIDPRKIGRRRLGCPVLAPEALATQSAGTGTLLLVAVGTRGARALIRARLADLGRQEGRDFLCLH
ncbi:MAG: glycosyltransferase [Candidatus Eisenbacteria sp.]|nr:glycosyltransferase [Candidatus Eisenbacteria bacterium]